MSNGVIGAVSPEYSSKRGKNMMKAVVMMLAMLLMLSASAYASESKNKGWFVYGIFEHEAMETGLTGGGMLSARIPRFGIGIERTFQHRFLKKLTLEAVTGSATIEERRESKHWSGGVLISHTIEHLTHQHSGRWKVNLSSELNLGRGWTMIPAAEWSNSWMPEMSQSEYAVRIGKRF